MQEEEALAFEKDPLFQDIIDMRSFDEGAKIADLDVPKLESYKELMIKNMITG